MHETVTTKPFIPKMRLERRALQNAGVAELYLTARPLAGGTLETQARQLFAAIRDELTQSDARIFCERIFATTDSYDTLNAIRREVYGELDDGVPPTRLAVDPGSYGHFAGVQLNAVRCAESPTVLRCLGINEPTMGRKLRNNGDTWVYVNGLNAGNGVPAPEQARRMFYCAGCFLRQAGTTMKSVARTWLWLRNICGWYDEFNAARNSFFESEGLIDREQHTTRLPASTGIGMYGANGAACTMDLIAMPGAEDQIQFLESGGDQNSAFEYGSAFSRAAIAPTLGGPTLFISGTAAIDRSGRTEDVGKIEAQVFDTIAHVRALLEQAGCSDAEVLTALVYCKTAEVEQVFRQRWPDLSWPRLTMVGDVCRPELLFEIEVTAGPARRLSPVELTPAHDARGDGNP